MKKTIKKLGVLIISAVMLLGLGGTIMADESMTGESGVIGEFTPPAGAEEKSSKVVIYKELTAYNPEDCTVNAPTITFNYTVSSSNALAGKNIYDAKSHHDPLVNVHVLTKQGVGSPTITGTGEGVIALVPGTNTLKASVNGTANRYPLTVDFSGIDFLTDGSGAGVYRYQIDETTTEAVKNAAGIKEGEVANTLYMDVYVDGDGKIYGYVLFTNNVDIDAREDDDAAAAAAAGKTEGFVGTVADQTAYSSDTSVADKYYTFNLEVTKTVVGDNYTKNNHHQFPFEITLDNTTVTANVLPIMTVSANATQAALSAGAIGTGASATTWTPTIADSAKVTYVGIPTGTTVTIKEQNDVTGVTYTSVSTNADTNADSKDIYTGEWSNTATVNCNATALTKAAENHTSTASTAKQVIFTNTLQQISPTGIIVRSAPYILLLGAAIVLFVLSRRWAKKERA